MSDNRIKSYGEFWPFYLQEHAKPVTRVWHYLGTTLALLSLAALIVTGDWPWLLGALLIGYGPAWIGHFFVEKNKPASFKYPLWSFISDFRMYFAFLSGRLGGELERAGVPAGRGHNSQARR